jgi:hypothetical protein
MSMKAAGTTYTPIKVGDLLYAVGPGHPTPHNTTDLLVYSTEVKAIHLDGSYSASCPPELLATAQLAIELDHDRPYLGFPKWVYQSHELGIKVHRSKTEALQTFAEHARRRRDQAERERERADQELQWALTAAEPSTEITP